MASEPRSSKVDLTAEYQPFPNEEGRNSRQSQLEIPAMVRALGIPGGKRILEVGCGRGIALPVIDQLCRPSLLVGLDIDPELLVEAAANLREHGTAAQLCAGDVRRMPFADESFDVVIDFGTLFHIAKPQAASAEIARILAPGGIFVHETMVSQLLSHPVRSRGRRLPRMEHDGLRQKRWAMLWASRAKGTLAAAERETSCA
ncbi:MAG TPA: class I SAM-dependent methyltransferase [Solirubrobacterales bacterium]|jgi:ubiquinone/menaquinone biosynthesis C-methylase UbiE|nr:class I SAM-dependent methyltransferase [Solirubrobacterales bacterium]